MLRLALSLLLALGCTTSFDLGSLPARDAAADRGIDVAGDIPAGDVPAGDVPAGDVPTGDVSTGDVVTCGEESLACCEGTRCAPGTVCSEGRCQRCPGTTSACGGACVDTQANIFHCGACGRACAPGQSCRAGSCALVCSPPLTLCGDVCVDVTRNPQHCGRCGNPCAAGATCGGGACALTCAGGTTDCGDGCVDTSADPSNCGGCGTPCTVPRGTPACRAGACRVGSCAAGFADCDGAVGDGCETDITTPMNCGACGNACAFAHATSLCRSGACAIATCAAGYANCDNDPANGCETDTQRDPRHCSACNRSCAASQTCAAGACVTASQTCDPGRADCDGVVANGCETDLTLPASCGRCGNACVAPHAAAICRAGACAVGACDADYGNCDGAVANGCETDLRSTAAHCGGCGAACAPAHATGACVLGVCRVGTCAAGWGDCDGDWQNGCETDLTATESHCGRCGVACTVANGAGACVGGRCTVTDCRTGFGDCDNNAANGCETDLRTDVANCGGCGDACVLPNAAARCDGGRCALARCDPAGFGDCDNNAANGCETDLQTSTAHCGRCGDACPAAPNAAPTCAAGACGLACATGWGDCRREVPGCETDLRVSPNSCGACGRRCPRPEGALETCAAGVCGYACNVGRGDCDNAAANGCETDLFADRSHCGRCGVACGGLDVECRGGACAFCRNGSNFATCGALRTCSVDLESSPEHCGGCRQECPPAQSHAHHATYSGLCGSAVCRYACDAGWDDCDGNWQNGCETNTACDTFHCSACGRSCGVGQACCAGECVSAGSAPRCDLNAPGCR